MKNLHKILAALMVIIIGIHLGLHYNMIALKLKFDRVVSIIMISISLAFGVYSLATTSFSHYLISSVSTHEREGNAEGQGLGKGQG